MRSDNKCQKRELKSVRCIKNTAKWREYYAVIAVTYEACGLYNTPIGNKYKPIFEG